MPIQILIVDDHQIVREGVRSLLSSSRPQWSLKEAENGPEVERMVRQGNPDVVIMDITMAGLSGLDVSRNLRVSGFNNPILVFTMHKSDLLGKDVREAGAQGYVLKSQAVEDLVRAIDTLLSGGTFFGAPVKKKANEDEKPGLIFFISLSASLA